MLKTDIFLYYKNMQNMESIYYNFEGQKFKSNMTLIEKLYSYYIH